MSHIKVISLYRNVSCPCEFFLWIFWKKIPSVLTFGRLEILNWFSYIGLSNEASTSGFIEPIPNDKWEKLSFSMENVYRFRSLSPRLKGIGRALINTHWKNASYHPHIRNDLQYSTLHWRVCKYEKEKYVPHVSLIR